MRIVSMVPSWTETLISCGIIPVGRTRFCIHPKETVKAIPVVGGTKDWNLEKLQSLQPDLILFDREENTKEMFDQWQGRSLVTHVLSVSHLQSAFLQLAQELGSECLREYSERLAIVMARASRGLSKTSHPSPEILGQIGGAQWDPTKPCVYVIWKNPWMAVNRGTYIASVIETLGWKLAELGTSELYPVVDESILKNPSVNVLFSSEPFPFHKKAQELEAQGLSGLVVDGEGMSWYGIRGLQFLEGRAGC